MTLRKEYPDIYKTYKQRQKERGDCCIDFTENVTELKTIIENHDGTYTLKFELFWEDFSFCPFCGTNLAIRRIKKPIICGGKDGPKNPYADCDD